MSSIRKKEISKLEKIGIELLRFADDLKENGFRVCTTKKDYPQYLIFSKNGNIGYVEHWPFCFGGWIFSSKHKPDKKYGSSCRIMENVELKLEYAELAVSGRSHSDTKYTDYYCGPKYYKDLEEYMSSNKPLEYVEL